MEPAGATRQAEQTKGKKPYDKMISNGIRHMTGIRPCQDESAGDPVLLDAAAYQY
jgi:hypothetical protein